MKKLSVLWAAAALASFAWTLPAWSSAPSGAIFTTLPDGSEVNFNQFPSKDAVYLDGGPGPGAPASAAGLDAGTYVFQVTDPSGKKLLSTDLAKCRQFTVDSSGLITGVVITGCQHLTGTDMDHNATTVQLMPYNDTPNPGGVYKVWVTLVGDFLAGCAALGTASGLDVVDCGFNAGNDHGFLPGNSKTDNFKVKSAPIREIDTQFFDGNGNVLDGRGITWLDTLGSSNSKWSYLNARLDINHEAHVEGIENGTHRIVIPNQAGCTVGSIYMSVNTPANRLGGTLVSNGPDTVEVQVSPSFKQGTIRLDVLCSSTQ